jgi:hypothetical protein
MPLQLPLNQSVKSQYTSGDEYVFIRNTEIAYIGYYYETGGKIFAGKEFSPVAQELIKKISVAKNTLIENPSTIDYARLSGMIVNSTPLKPAFFNPSKGMIRYFAKKVSSSFINIIEIDKETYMALAKDPFYQILKVDYGSFYFTSEGLDALDKQMLGLKAYLQHELTKIVRFSKFG